MKLWPKKAKAPSGPSAAQISTALTPLTARIEALRVPCAVISVADDVTPAATGSFIGGHPYLPTGVRWPADDEGPMVFVGQFRFAGMPALPGFPADGLLQWFVSNEDAYGQTFDDTAGTTGFHAKWFPDVSEPSESGPNSPTPVSSDAYTPTESARPIAIGFAAGSDLPAWDELAHFHPALAEDAAWERVESELGADQEFIWHEYVRAGADRSRVGGYANFTQFDPRWIAEPWRGVPLRLIVELDSQDGLTGWGDGGIGHLLGDPQALSAGDLGGIRYHWDCM